MKGFDSLLSYRDAISSFSTEKWKFPGTVKIPIDRALGKISYDNVLSVKNIPCHDKSAMDGYAVLSKDTINASSSNPAKLISKGYTAAGDPPGNVISSGECMEVYTGSIMPNGADAVARAENGETIGKYVYVYSPVSHGKNVSYTGEDIKKGDIIVNKNTIIYPQNIAAMKATRIQSVNVYKKISIGIINTGKELVNGQIENSTGMLLRTFYETGYTEAIDGGIVDDDIPSIIAQVKSIIEKCHIIIITGGSSLGRRDMTTEALSSQGKIIFSGVSIKPGRTIALFNINNRPVLSVSGLPVAALISSMVFVNQYIKNIYGIWYIHKAVSIMDESIHNRVGTTTFQIAETSGKNGELHSVPVKTTVSGMISAMIRGNSIIKIDEDMEGLPQGSMATIYIMGDIKWD